MYLEGVRQSTQSDADDLSCYENLGHYEVPHTKTFPLC